MRESRATSGSYPNARKISVENIDGTIVKMRKKAVRMKAPLFRYKPHKRKLPCPKPCEVSVSMPVLRPTIIERINTSMKTLARPTTASFVGSFI